MRGLDRELKLNPYQITAVSNAAERTIADQALILEERMGFLSTAASAAPLLGLLGTVWGVMDTFSSMAKAGAASIGDVAPGISGAHQYRQFRIGAAHQVHLIGKFLAGGELVVEI